MPGVERRMYRRRRRNRRRWLTAAGILLVATALSLVLTKQPVFRAENVAQPTPTAMADTFDRNVETREAMLPETVWYTIQTGVFSAREAAEEKAKEYADRGAPGVVMQDGAKWRVFIASYGSESEASAVRQRLGEMQRVETYLYAWKCSELRLRLTGMAGQLDLASAGMSLFMDAAATLRDTAILLDAGQLTGDEALQAAVEINNSVSLWSRTTRERFGRQQPDLVKALLLLADSWQEKYQAIRNGAATVTGLSAALKAQGMCMYDEMIRLRAGIASK